MNTFFWSLTHSHTQQLAHGHSGGYHGRGCSIGSCGGIIADATNSTIIMTVSNCGGNDDEFIGEFIHHCSIIGAQGVVVVMMLSLKKNFGSKP